MKTNLGKITFSNGAPSIKEIIECSHEHIGLELDYTVLGLGTALVIFKNRPSWGVIISLGKNSINITDEFGRVEGPVVAQSVLKIAKELGGKGQPVADWIDFPLTLDLLEKYEKRYINESRASSQIINTNTKVLSLVIFCLAFLWFW